MSEASIITWDALKEHQENVGLRIKSMLSEEYGPYVVAVCGGRGSGKSTILKLLTNDLVGENHLVIYIDASTITKNQGIMATSVSLIEELVTSKIKNVCTKEDQLVLNQKYTRCLDCAITSESSIHKLAREMAMTPEQYRNFLTSWDKDKNNFAKMFKDFQKTVISNWNNALQKTSNYPDASWKKIYVILDDLDLCTPNLIRNWANTFMKSSTDTTKNLCWILSFDRPRLITILSDNRSIEQHENIDIGESTLTKIIPYHQQFDLQSWNENDKLHFMPFNRKPETKALIDLLRDLSIEDFIFFLPDTPRGLESIYLWLDNEVSINGKQLDRSLSRQISPTRLLRKFAEVANNNALASFLLNVKAERIALQFSWDTTEPIGEQCWSAIASSANKGTSLRGLPVPQNLVDLVKTRRPDSTFETLCNIALRAGELTSFQMVMDIPFLREALDVCRSRFKFTESDIITQFQENQEATAWSLVWGSWKRSSEAHIWTFEMGPVPLVEALTNLRSISPSEMIYKLYLSDPGWSKYQLKVENSVPQALRHSLEREPLLPKNFRALIILIDSWKDAPWSELEQVATFWMPITVAQISAAFILIGYAYTIWSNQRILEAMVGEHPCPAEQDDSQDKNLAALDSGHLFYHLEPFSALKDKTAEHIDQAYGRILAAIKRLLEKEPELFDIFNQPQTQSDSPYTVLELTARKAIKEQLKKLASLEPVCNLRLNRTSQ